MANFFQVITRYGKVMQSYDLIWSWSRCAKLSQDIDRFGQVMPIYKAIYGDVITLVISKETRLISIESQPKKIVVVVVIGVVVVAVHVVVVVIPVVDRRNTPLKFG